MLKALVFDLNGVLIDTTELNASIFELLLETVEEGAGRKAAEHYRLNGGIPRKKRIKMYIEMFTQADADDETVEMLTEMFSAFFRMNAQNIELLSGVKDFLEQNRQKYRFFVSSGATVDDTRFILENKGLLKFFDGVYGSPSPKKEHLLDIMKKNLFQPGEVVFIGDSPHDKTAADEAGVGFIAKRTNEHHWHSYTPAISDFSQLEPVLMQYFA